MSRFVASIAIDFPRVSKRRGGSTRHEMQHESILRIIASGVGLIFPLFILPSSSRAAERPVDQAECKVITTRLIEATDAEFDRFSPLGDNVFLKSGLTGQIVLMCGTHRMTGVSLSWETAYPSNSWFDIAARAGTAVTGAKKLEPLIRKCHRTALASKSELAELDAPNVAKIECQAFTRDGGGVTMSIWINDHEARKGIEEP
jgi:hypothetical protein